MKRTSIFAVKVFLCMLTVAKTLMESDGLHGRAKPYSFGACKTLGTDQSMKRLSLDQHQTPEHSVANKALNELALQLNQANVNMILLGAASKDRCRKTQVRVLSAQMLSAIGSLNAVLRLTEALSLNIKDAIALTRVYYETCFTVAFTALDNGERAERADLYSIYKMFRTQTRSQKAGLHLLKVQRSPRISRDKEHVKKALSIFGSGKKIRPCFEEDRAQMLVQISQRDPTAGLFFGGVEGMIFDVSSEIIHGSFYSYEVVSGFGIEPSNTVDNLMSHYESVLFSICLSSAAVSRILRESLAPTSEMEKIEATSFAAIKPYIPEDMQNKLGGYLRN